MNEDDTWLSSNEFATLAAITPQAARKALRAGAWRGKPLKVRNDLKRGGRSGLTYLVRSSSLPEHLQAPSRALDISPRLPPRAAGKQAGRIADRWNIISPALAHPAGSPERAAAIIAAADNSKISSRTLYNWIARYQAVGLRGLARTAPADAGQRRVVVSRTFDQAFRAAGYDDELLLVVGQSIDKSIKGLWASRAEQAGGNEIRRLAEFLLLETCEAHGVTIDRRAIRMSRRAIARFASYRVVNQRRNDRKAFDDGKPRIRRDWTSLAPMERVVADVKHLDVVVTRPDGSTAWPKIVAFMDAGTGRVFVHPVLLDRGEGVRQEHVIEAFLAMANHADWGFPQGLYLDNGSEFAALTKIDSALQDLNEPGVRTIIFARPYNAAAKPIESLFARLDKHVFSLMPGYAGRDRLAKKTQTVGKPPKPYPGDWDEFCETLQDLIAAHHQRPVGGQWADRSPIDWFQAKVADGWRPVTVDPSALDAAFADHDSRRVDRGTLRIGGQRFTHPALAALPNRTIVDLALPWRRGVAPLARVPDKGWIRLQAEVLYPARWIEGAREADRRQAAQTRHVRALEKDAPSIDPVAAKIRWSKRVAAETAAELPPPLPQTPRRPTRRDPHDFDPEARPDPSREELMRARQMALTERLERKMQNDE